MFQHNLCHGITIYDKRNEYVDLWAFATERNNNGVYNLYVNKMFLIKKFILYFQEKAHSLLFPNTIDLKVSTKNQFKINKVSSYKHQEQIPFSPNRYYIDRDHNLYLTPAELHSVLHIAEGMSAKETAIALGVSPKTIESNIESIRLKTNSHSKSEYIQKCKYLINMNK
jgi:DNA-binding CsgD family transcriptional regulator